MGRIRRLEQHLKRFDYQLYVERREGKLCVMRKSTRVEYYNVDGVSIGFVRPTPHFVFALTHNWKLDGQECDWGIEPIMFRIKQCDTWARDMVSEIERNEQRIEASIERDLHNETEAFAKDWRREFARTFDDVNTANLTKTDSRRKQDVYLK